jgi:CheY-like chemotaxis protein
MARPLQRILLVEDDVHVRTTAKLVLEVMGRYEVCECATGAEALRSARRFQPDLFLLDMVLPGADGVEVLRALRRVPQLAGVPAVFVTAHTRAGDLARYSEAGAIGVIAKPLTPMRLPDQLRRAWEAGALAST